MVTDLVSFLNKTIINFINPLIHQHSYFICNVYYWRLEVNTNCNTGTQRCTFLTLSCCGTYRRNSPSPRPQNMPIASPTGEWMITAVRSPAIKWLYPFYLPVLYLIYCNVLTASRSGSHCVQPYQLHLRQRTVSDIVLVRECFVRGVAVTSWCSNAEQHSKGKDGNNIIKTCSRNDDGGNSLCLAIVSLGLQVEEQWNDYFWGHSCQHRPALKSQWSLMDVWIVFFVNAGDSM